MTESRYKLELRNLVLELHDRARAVDFANDPDASKKIELHCSMKQASAVVPVPAKGSSTSPPFGATRVH